MRKNVFRTVGIMLLGFAFLLVGLVPVTTLKAETQLNAPKIKSAKTSTGSVILKWKKVSGASGYKVYKFDSSKNSYVEYGESLKTKCKITGLESGKTYKFKVSAYTVSGGKKIEGKQSKVYEVKTNKKAKLNCSDFMVYDGDGKTHNLSDYVGKPIVVNMWATWCPPCCSELPEFDEVYKEYKGKVQFMMVNVEESYEADGVKDFIKDNGYSFPVFYDWDYIMEYTYGTGYIPTTLVINSDGDIIYNEVGTLSADSLISLIEEAM